MTKPNFCFLINIKRPPPPAIERQPLKGCAHHWDCDSPKDGWVFQRCRLCRGEKCTPSDPLDGRRLYIAGLSDIDEALGWAKEVN